MNASALCFYSEKVYLTVTLQSAAVFADTVCVSRCCSSEHCVFTVARVLRESCAITHITVRVILLFGSFLHHAAGHMSKRWLCPSPSV